MLNRKHLEEWLMETRPDFVSVEGLALLIVNDTNYNNICQSSHRNKYLTGGIPYDRSAYRKAPAASTEVRTRVKQLDDLFTTNHRVFVANDFVIDPTEELPVWPKTSERGYNHFCYGSSVDTLFVCGRPTEDVFQKTCQELIEGKPNLQVVIITDAILVSDRYGNDITQKILTQKTPEEEKTENKLLQFKTSEQVFREEQQRVELKEKQKEKEQKEKAISQMRKAHHLLSNALRALEDSIDTSGNNKKTNSGKNQATTKDSNNIVTAISELKESLELKESRTELPQYIQTLRNFQDVLKKHTNTLREDPSGHGEKFIRLVLNILSFLAFAIPAIIRGCESNNKYNTYRFWQRESEQFVTGASNILDNIPELKSCNLN